MWALGNVEAVAVARGNVDEKRAVGRGSGSYLASLDADERPLKGVHVDDPVADGYPVFSAHVVERLA